MATREVTYNSRFESGWVAYDIWYTTRLQSRLLSSEAWHMNEMTPRWTSEVGTHSWAMNSSSICICTRSFRCDTEGRVGRYFLIPARLSSPRAELDWPGHPTLSAHRHDTPFAPAPCPAGFQVQLVCSFHLTSQRAGMQSHSHAFLPENSEEPDKENDNFEDRDRDVLRFGTEEKEQESKEEKEKRHRTIAHSSTRSNFQDAAAACMRQDRWAAFIITKPCLLHYELSCPLTGGMSESGPGPEGSSKTLVPVCECIRTEN
ncbi:uncharacterized protein BDZ83DRAFT_776825 [Colletotrichum acutatum]|uniref:Uncharacterized protein n=1 Tax=Glomerella acutata TaxID=27357 RepID=A0AAD8UMM2_GLOAC|nr:uncharacterized protein BDZ83DRAFT_776825 [Colletotrichum acutatum]KAK1725602.1 hypothetical protein BDZ83DRAFT_776825 [Colletotrichum acutatum]